MLTWDCPRSSLHSPGISGLASVSSSGLVVPGAICMDSLETLNSSRDMGSIAALLSCRREEQEAVRMETWRPGTGRGTLIPRSWATVTLRLWLLCAALG